MRTVRLRFARPLLAAAILLAAGAAGPALAQIVHHSPFAAHPFAVGASEGAVGHQNALGAWLIAQESRFYLELTGAVRAARTGPGALWLAALSFAYGVFHAAGPGHGKAVISSYMLSNEVAVRRGVAVALLAALFQGLVATALVGAAVFVFHATAPRMTGAARLIELVGYAGIVALGLALTWRKGRSLARAVAARRAELRAGCDDLAARIGFAPLRREALAGQSFAGPALMGAGTGRPMLRQGGAAASGRFRADGGGTVSAAAGAAPHAAGCACFMPAPLGDDRLDLRAAALAVVTAGARPCSGAVLVLVFSASQGLFLAGVAATTAMALGTAVTTAALAILAVAAKGLALRLAGGAGSSRASLVGRGVEFAAALAVLLFGAALFGAWLAGAAGAG